MKWISRNKIDTDPDRLWSYTKEPDGWCMDLPFREQSDACGVIDQERLEKYLETEATLPFILVVNEG